MSHRRFGTIVVSVAVVCLACAAAYACRPFETEDTGITPPGEVSFEVASEYETGTVVSKSFRAVANVGTGITQNVQACLNTSGIVYSNDGGDRVQGLEDWELVLKWRFQGDDESTTATAVFVTAALPTGDKSEGLGSGNYDGAAALAWSARIPYDVTVYANAGVNLAQSADDTATIALAAEKPLTDRVRLAVECVSDQGLYGGRDDDSTRALVGTIIDLNDKVALDAAIRVGLDNRTPDFGAFLGLSSAF